MVFIILKLPIYSLRTGLIDTYMKHKNIFEPSYVIEMSEEDLKNIIVNYMHSFLCKNEIKVPNCDFIIRDTSQ